MGACCGGGSLPETEPNIEKATETPRGPLIQQNQSQATNVIAAQNEDEDSKPVSNNVNHVNQHSHSDNNECNNDKATIHKTDAIPNVNNNVAFKPSTHQRVASESTESTVFTQTQTIIIHETAATNTSMSSIASSLSTDATVSDCKSMEHKLTALNEAEHANPENKYETKPMSTQTILPMYLLTSDDIHNWSNKQSLHNQLDANHTCTQTIDACEYVQRLLFVTKLYNQCINHKESSISTQQILEHLHPHKDYQCLNDYFHFMDYHFDAIKPHYFDKKCGECHAYECVAYIRNHRDRHKQTEDRYYDCEATDYALIAIQQILDSIHCFVFHSVVCETDKKQKEEILKQRHSNLYTINIGIDLDSTTSKTEAKEDTLQELDGNESKDNFTPDELTKILQQHQQQSLSSSPTTLKSKVKSKRRTKRTLVPHNSIFKSPSTAAVNTQDAFGHHMFCEHDTEFILPTYSDLKQELVFNAKAPLNEQQWNVEDAKAKILKRTYKIHEDMSLDQIVALLVYCNYNALREGLLCSFTQKTQHKDYYHWAQLLFSVIKQFGETDQEISTFPETYCALNILCKFYSFNHCNFNGLFSATNDLSTVQCCNTYLDGIILKLHASQFGVAPFIHLSLFSDFKDESHQLFGFSSGCVLQIDDILTMEDISNGHRNQQFIAALQLLEQVVIDTPYIEAKKQYKWLQNSVQKALVKQNDSDTYTVIDILEHMLCECLRTDDAQVKEKEAIMEIPTFIQTQFDFFRHCLRDNEFCTLCFDLTKMKLLPPSIQKYFMADNKISYGHWRRLFPNDRAISVKNVEQNKYESFINLFATLVIELGDQYSDCLQCVDINTNDTEYDKDINDMIQHKNNYRFKYSNWTLSYEQKQSAVGDKAKGTYCISIRKGNTTYDDITALTEIQNGNIAVSDDDKEEEEEEAQQQHVEDGAASDIEMKVNVDNESMNTEIKQKWAENVVETKDIAEDDTNEKHVVVNNENDDDHDMNELNGIKIGDDLENRASISSISVPSIDTEEVPALLNTVLTAVDEFKQSKENTPFSFGSTGTGTRTASPPFGNRWCFDSNTTTENESDAAAISDMDANDRE